MLSRAMRSYINANMLLLAIIGALGYINWQLWFYTPDVSPIAVQAAAGERSARGAAADSSLISGSVSVAQPSQTTSRPLFFANRRPPDKAESTAATTITVAPQLAPRSSLAQFQLVGIMRTGRKNRRALIRTEADGQGVWIGVGEHIQGWQLKEIDDDKAIFEADGQRGQIQLYTATTAKNR